MNKALTPLFIKTLFVSLGFGAAFLFLKQKLVSVSHQEWRLLNSEECLGLCWLRSTGG